MIRIALDAMGGDRGPDALVSGALLAVEDSGYELEIVLFGDENQVTKALWKAGRSGDPRISVRHTTEIVGMDESPTEAIRKKKDSSIVQAFQLVRKKNADAVVSAGNSGATMAAAIRFMGRLKNISRPGIASVFPTLKGPVVMMDVGANVDCRPKHLFQFGVMADSFVNALYGVDKPRVGIMSNGEENDKGNALVKKTHKLFRESSLNFIGNIEGGDTWQGNVDVIVCDGFVGNVCLKISEGLAEAILSMLRDEILKTYKAKMGYYLAKDAFARFRKRVDYAEYGGAPLLGLNGVSVVSHGKSNATAIKNAILVAAELVHKKVNDQILQMLENNSFLLSASKQESLEAEGEN